MTTVWVRHDDDWSAWGADEVDCHYATEDLAGWLEALADGHGRPRPAD
jgi:hypothetical protein